MQPVKISCQLFQPDDVDRLFYTIDTSTIRINSSETLSKENNAGKWGVEEVSIYTKFLKDHLSFLEEGNFARRLKIYKILSQYLGHTRTPRQCRSHHLKMLSIHKNIKNLVQNLQLKLCLNAQNTRWGKEVKKEEKKGKEVLEEEEKKIEHVAKQQWEYYLSF